MPSETVPLPIKVTPIALTLTEAQIRKMFKKHGRVKTVFFATDQNGQKITVERIPTGDALFTYRDLGAMEFMLEMRKEGATPADTPVPHQFGTAFVVMADEEQSLMAAMTLDGVVLEGSVIHTTTVAESDRECVECSKRFAKNSGGCEIM